LNALWEYNAQMLQRRPRLKFLPEVLAELGSHNRHGQNSFARSALALPLSRSRDLGKRLSKKENFDLLPNVA
jgi:hypothetical protein